MNATTDHSETPVHPTEHTRIWAPPTLMLVAALFLVALSLVPNRPSSLAWADGPSSQSSHSRSSSSSDRSPSNLPQALNPPILLPFTGRQVDLRDRIPPATAVPATQTPTPSSTPTETLTPEPTQTPTPSPTPTVKPFDAEETSSDLKFTGAWQRVADAKASGGGYMIAKAAGATLSVTFSGNDLVLYRTVALDGGQASIDIDGKSYGSLLFYFSEKRYQVASVFDNLGAGVHKLTLTVEADKPTGSTGISVYVDALRSPTGFSANAGQERALKHSNWYRDAAGLPLLRLDRAIDLSAQSHADYDSRSSEGHSETKGKAGFTGPRFWDRLGYYGYNFASSEVMAWASDLTPEIAIDIWMTSVYHRLPFMDHVSTDLGYGEALESRMRVGVIDLGDRDHVPPPQRSLITWPPNGQRDVPTNFGGGEGPDPLPGADWPVGYPASLHIAQPAGRFDTHSVADAFSLGSVHRLALPGFRIPGAAPADWKLTSAKLTDSTGAEVQAYVIDQASDKPKYLGPDLVYVIAKKPLKATSTYTVRIIGQDSRSKAFDHQWSFTTGQADPLAR